MIQLLDTLTQTQLAPFTIALVIILIIALLEGATALIGVTLFGLLDSLTPNLDLSATAEVETTGPLSGLLGWLRIGKIPLLILLIIFLTAFGLTGLLVQFAANNITGNYLAAGIAATPATLLGLFSMNKIGGWIERLLPDKDETAVSRKSFIGRTATIIRGTAKTGLSAEAKLKDQFDQVHYIMVEPDEKEQTFQEGDVVLLVSNTDRCFMAISPPSDALLDD